MNKHNVTVVVVEGATDKTFLEVPLQQVFNITNQRIVFTVVGDVTSNKTLTDKNFVRTICAGIDKSLSELGLRKSDLSQILHVTDLDGAFIPDDRIVGGWSGKGFFYGDDGIHVPYAEAGRARNNRKRRRIEILLGKDRMHGVPYSLLYMSHNIEHVIVDERNCEPGDKRPLAKEKRLLWEDDISTFINLIQTYDHGCASWADSWAYVRTDMHSLERGTNLRFALPDGWDRISGTQLKEDT